MRPSSLASSLLLLFASHGALAAPSTAPVAEVATGEREPPPPVQIAPAVTAATGAREPPPPGPVLLGALAMGPLTPSVYGVRSGGSSRTGGGLALLSYAGQGWYMPAPGQDGTMVKFGGRIATVEVEVDTSASVFAWPLDGHVAVGQRWALGGEHHVRVLAGLDGLARVTLDKSGAQRKNAYLHVPELSVGYQWHSERTLIELGPRGGLAVVGRNSAVLGADSKPAGTDTYTLRPLAGAQASLVTSNLLLAVEAQRTWLSGGPGHVDERASGLLCHRLLEGRRGAGFGGCLSASLAHGRLDAPEVWSYETVFTIGLTEFAGS